MTQLSHSAFPHMGQPQAGKTQPKGPIKQQIPVSVRTVAPPEMEAELQAAQQAPSPQETFIEAPANTSSIPGIMDDGAVQANLDRKRIFEKLVLFREDHTTEAIIGGLTFRLKLLNANENSYVLKQMKNIPADEQLNKLNLMVLAAAVVDVNGVRLEDVYSGPPELTDVIMRKYYELSMWHSPVTNAIMLAYSKFQESVEKEYTQDFLAK